MRGSRMKKAGKTVELANATTRRRAPPAGPVARKGPSPATIAFSEPADPDEEVLSPPGAGWTVSRRRWLMPMHTRALPLPPPDAAAAADTSVAAAAAAANILSPPYSQLPNAEEAVRNRIKTCAHRVATDDVSGCLSCCCC